MIELLSNLGAVGTARAAEVVGSSASFRWEQFKLFSFAKGGSVTEAQKLLANIINAFLIIVFIVAFIYLVLYGVKYITSGGDAAKATEARNGIINAIIGIVVITLAFFIIKFAVGFGTSLGNLG